MLTCVYDDIIGRIVTNLNDKNKNRINRDRSRVDALCVATAASPPTVQSAGLSAVVRCVPFTVAAVPAAAGAVARAGTDRKCKWVITNDIGTSIRRRLSARQVGWRTLSPSPSMSRALPPVRVRTLSVAGLQGNMSSGASQDGGETPSTTTTDAATEAPAAAASPGASESTLGE